MNRNDFKKKTDYDKVWEINTKNTGNNKVFKHKDGFLTRRESANAVSNLMFNSDKLEEDGDDVVKDVWKYDYDKNKRITAIEHYINPHTEEEYNRRKEAGELNGIEEPSNYSYYFEYDDKNRLVAMKQAYIVIIRFEYYDSGAVKSITLHEGVHLDPTGLCQKLGIQEQRMYYNEDGSFEHVEFGELKNEV